MTCSMLACPDKSKVVSGSTKDCLVSKKRVKKKGGFLGMILEKSMTNTSLVIAKRSCLVATRQ